MNPTIHWQDRKRYFGLPISFTKYFVTDDRLFMERGLFTSVHDEVMLFRVRDTQVVRTLWQKLFGCGTVIVYSADKSQPQLRLESIKDPLNTKEILVKLVEEARRKNRVYGSEMIMDAAAPHEHDCPCDDEM
ncbi:MAG: PH domain-containing protein [Clostridia bacterium]|nr:PH domain-containing protein [Clostridia bacterium]